MICGLIFRELWSVMKAVYEYWSNKLSPKGKGEK